MVKLLTSLAKVVTSPGSADGYVQKLDLDYDPAEPTIKVAWMVRARDLAGVLKRAFWLNEAGAPRARAVKNEAALKLYGNGGGYYGPVLEVFTDDTGGTVVYCIDGYGRPRLGASRLVGSNVIYLDAADPLPSGLPDGTLVVRY